MKQIVVFFYVFCISSFLAAQTPLSLSSCEELFLNKNLYLLAEEFNITKAEANVIQAKLWENPYFSTELNAINPQDNRLFDVGANGQKGFAIEQLIYLGGKKKNEVAFARINVAIRQAEFNDLLRQLRYQLRVSYFAIFYDYIAIATLEKQISNLDSLLSAYTIQAAKNNVSFKDVVRLQSLYLNLKNSKSDLMQEIFEEEKKLAILLSQNEKVTLTPLAEELSQYQKQLTTTSDELIKIASENRPDLLIHELSVEASQTNLRLQKALAIPNVTVGANYDQRGGAFQNQINLTLGIPLPILNRNQGNIKVTDAELQQSNTQKELHKLLVNQEVMVAYNKHKDAYENHLFITKNANPAFEEIFNSVTLNFQKRNIGIMEFTDFVESYNETVIQYNKIQKQLTNACEEINHSTNSTIF